MAWLVSPMVRVYMDFVSLKAAPPTAAQKRRTSFHVRRRGRMGSDSVDTNSQLPALLELNADGSEVVGTEPRTIYIHPNVTELGSDRALRDAPNGMQIFGPYIHPRHCVLASMDGVVTLTPSNPKADLAVNGHPIRQTTILAHNAILRIGQSHVFRFIHPHGARAGAGSLRGGSVTSSSHEEASLSSSAVASLERSMTASAPSPVPRFQPKPPPRASLRMQRSQRRREDASQDSTLHSPSDSEAPGPDSNQPAATNPQRPDSLLFKSATLASLTRPSHFESPIQQTVSPTPTAPVSAMETTFDVDGTIDTKPHHGPIPTTPVTPMGEDNSAPGARQAASVSGTRDAIPAILELLDDAEEALLSAVVRDVIPAETAFKLGPAYALYMGCRYRVSPHYRTSLVPQQRLKRLVEFLTKTANLLHVVIQDHCHDGEALALWMANASELLNFVKLDRDMGAVTRPEPQESLADAVEKAFAHLGACLKEDLNGALPSFLDPSLDDEAATRPCLFMLSGAMALLRQSRCNAALTIQLFSQLFHYINMYLFNWLVSREGAGYCCRAWGTRLRCRLELVQAWSLKQGLELAAECHLDRVVQAVKLLETPKRIEELAALGSTCYKLNSLQVRDLLGRYQTEPGEAPMPAGLAEKVGRVAEAQADELAAAEGRPLRVEEDPDLGLPFLLPEDGYSPDLVKGIPGPLQDFIDRLLTKGICRMILQPSSTGSWTVHMRPSTYNTLPEATTSGRAGPEVVQITFNKGPNGGIGLSIVCAQGVGERDTGIYVKKVVEGSAAERDGRLEAGDQLVRVNGHPLVGVEQEIAARLMAASGPSVSFEVAKQAALYNGLATWLYSTSPDPSPLSSRPRSFTPTGHLQQQARQPQQQQQQQQHQQPQRGPPPSAYARHIGNSQHGRSLSHSSLDYGSGGASSGNYQNMAYHSQHQRPPSVHGTSDFQRPQHIPQAHANPGYLQQQPARVNGYSHQRHSSQSSQPPMSSQPPPAMSRSYETRGSLTSLRSGAHAPASPRLFERMAERNGSSTPPASNGIFRAPQPPMVISRQSSSPRPLLAPRLPDPPPDYQGTLETQEYRGSNDYPGPLAQSPQSPPLPPPPPLQYTEPYRAERPSSRNGIGNGSPMRPPSVPPISTPSLYDEREEKEQLEARMSLEVIRMMEEEVQRLEAKEYLNEAEERRYRAIKYDLAYKRRLMEADNPDEEDAPPPPPTAATPGAAPLHNGNGHRLAAGMDDVSRLQTEVERTLRLEPDQRQPEPTPVAPPLPQKKIPPAVPPKKKTVQFGPPPTSSSTSSASLSPRIDDAAPPPPAQIMQPHLDPSRRYIYESGEREQPRAQVIGAQEVYRDPRQQRLAKLNTNAPQTTVDGSNLNFRDKMRLFAAQLGENTPKQGAKSSKAQRHIEDTVLTPPT